MTDTMVRYYDSSMSGITTLRGEIGSLIDILDDCLCDGFGSVTLTGDKIVVSSNVATCTVSGGHNFAMLGVNVIGPVIRIEGVTGDYASALNKDWRVASIPLSTSFTFATTGIPDGTYSSGTITAKRAPAGFTKVYSGTNTAVYRADDTGSGSNRFYLRVDDSTTTYALVRAYESMIDVNTGTNPFPTTIQVSAANGRWMKSSTASNATRDFVLFADSRRFAFMPAWSASYTVREFYCFGDFVSYKSGDAYNGFLNLSTASASNPGSNNNFLCPWNTTYSGYIARDYTQLGTACQSKLISCGPSIGSGASSVIGLTSATTLLSYPNNSDDSLILWGELEIDDILSLRGKLSGFYVPAQKAPLTDLAVISGVSGLSNRVLMALKVCSSATNEGRIFIDLTSWQ